jgi:two-component system sensor histidine kinase KdpD
VRAETERLRNSLLSSVSHDLRTPLASITGAASTLLESEERLDAGTRRDLLEALHEEADRLNRLVQNLLEMTRLESGALQLRTEWHSIEEVVGAALGRFGKALARRAVSVRVPADLPLVPMDDVLIEQVLINLVDNAIKYTPPESPIEVSAEDTGAAVLIEFADRGPGLPPGEERHIFEKFHRAEVTPPVRGAGLGLAICRGIVQAHGGRIWAENRPGGGVTVRFTLPRKEAPPIVSERDGA